MADTFKPQHIDNVEETGIIEELYFDTNSGEELNGSHSDDSQESNMGIDSELMDKDANHKILSRLLGNTTVISGFRIW
jgi:hypothetical protein